MKTIGIGVDIVKNNRIKFLLKNKNFINRIFNEKEVLKCRKNNNSINCYAKRFAAKEAFSKALGTGISNGTNFNEIVVLNTMRPAEEWQGKNKNAICIAAYHSGVRLIDNIIL